MTCKIIVRGPGIMAISCSRSEPHTHCAVIGCPKTAVSWCTRPVLNRATGGEKVCGMKLCAEHAGGAEAVPICPPHRRWDEKKAAR